MSSPNPAMLTLLRESRGLTISALKEESGIPQSTISKMENGASPIPGDRLEVLAKTLRYPVEVFSWTDRVYGFGSTSFFHRKQQSLSQRLLRKIQAKINLSRMQLTRLTRAVDVEAEFSLPSIQADEVGSPTAVAQAVRALWMIPMGPIQNVITVIERAGIVVERADFESPKISAVSNGPVDGAPALIVLNTNLLPDRERFTLAHELGHLVMHSGGELPVDGERQADEFAAEFLMPAREVRSQLGSLNLEKAMQLKSIWKVSAGVVIRRSKDLGQIDDSRYRSLNVQISQRGWRKAEPQTFERDTIAVTPGLIEAHLGPLGYKPEELARVVGLLDDEFAETYDWHVTPEPARRHLHVVS